MKIAVVGGGVSRLTAAYLLNRKHDIEVFEQNDYAGGHANTVVAEVGGVSSVSIQASLFTTIRRIRGSMGCCVNSAWAERRRHVDQRVRCRACRVEYSSRGLGGMLAQRSSVLRPARWPFGWDILRFFRDTRRVLREGRHEQATLDGFLRDRRYSGEFVRHFIVPLASAVWSTPPVSVATCRPGTSSDSCRITGSLAFSPRLFGAPFAAARANMCAA